MKSIGLDVKPPSKSCDDPVCPFHGSLSVRGRVLRGRAASVKARNLAVVEREYLHYVSKYMRYEKRSSRISAHLPPCLDIKEGDEVTVAECRPLAKSIAFVIVEKVS